MKKFNILEYLKSNTLETTNYFILDSHEGIKGEKGSTDHNDQDFIQYCYDTKRNNKLKPGDIFIYRRPKKTSKNRKFFFYGGGVIKKIESRDKSNPNLVKALIIKPFKFSNPLYEDDLKVKEFNWTFKTKGRTWEHFWSQYGINQINKSDFFNLIDDLECIEVDLNAQNPNELDINENDEKENISKEQFQSEFTITEVFDEKKKNDSKKRKSNIKTKARKLDYSEINEKKLTMGLLGENLIIQKEINNLIAHGREDLISKVKHVSKKNDDLGYDIISIDETGAEKFIEVKTTKGNIMDGFFISPKEIRVSKHYSSKYYIYRLYNVNITTKTASLKIFEGAIIKDLYNLEPIGYKVTLK